MMKIKVYGKEGCAKCTKVKEKIEKVVKKNKITDANVEKVNDVQELIEKGVMSTPAVSKDGEIVIKGKVPTTDEILGFLE